MSTGRVQPVARERDGTGAGDVAVRGARRNRDASAVGRDRGAVVVGADRADDVADDERVRNREASLGPPGGAGRAHNEGHDADGSEGGRADSDGGSTGHHTPAPQARSSGRAVMALLSKFALIFATLEDLLSGRLGRPVQLVVAGTTRVLWILPSPDAAVQGGPCDQSTAPQEPGPTRARSGRFSHPRRRSGRRLQTAAGREPTSA